VVAPSFQGEASLFNTQMWAGSVSAKVEGDGQLLLQQLNTLTGPIHLNGGRCRVEGICFQKDSNPHVELGEDCEEAVLLGCFSENTLFVQAASSPRLYARANGLQANAAVRSLETLKLNRPGGVYESPLRLKIKGRKGRRIRYTLDGTQPSKVSPLYKRPLALKEKGLWEVRFRAEDKQGNLDLATGRELYELR